MKKIAFPIFLLCITQICVGQQYFNKLIDLGDGSPEVYRDIIYDNTTNSLWISGSITNSVNPKLVHLNLLGVVIDTFDIKTSSLGSRFSTGYGSSLFIDATDNIILMGGNKYNTNYNGVVHKINQNGDTLWVKEYGDSNYSDGLISGLQDTDSTYIFSGFTSSLTMGVADLWLLKTDTAGNILWQNNLGGGGVESTLNIEKTVDGGFVISGYTSSFGAGGNDIYIVKTDANGNFLWQKTFGGMSYDSGLALSLNNGEILVFGAYNFISPDDSNLINTHGVVLKLDQFGNELWSNIYANSNENSPNYYLYREGFNSAIIINDGYIFSGASSDSLDNNPLGWLVKTDFNGNQLWSRRFRKRNNDNYFQDIVALPGGDLVMVGFVFAENNTQTQDGWLVRTNCLGFDAPPLALGTWHNAVDNTVILENNSKRFGDGKILWGDGETTTFTEFDDTLLSHTYLNSGNYNAKLIVNACYHTDTTTISVQSSATNLAEFSLKNTFKLYPNPTQSNVNITYNINDGSSESVITIYDLTGKLIKTIQLTDQHNNIMLNVMDFDNGIYLVNITSNKGDSVTKKLIVQ